ncbi:MAG: tetratricopeptide repeat protein [Deltaproteobacteria bacterium]|nr:tetratricopeptide repeat protein [Deltaproteobacteria bacterium]
MDKLKELTGRFEAQPDADTACQIGDEYLKSGQRVQANTYYARALEMAPGHPGVHLGLGRLALDTNKIDLALTYLTKAARLDKNSPDILNELGVCYGRKDMWDAAETVWSRALEIHPGHGKSIFNLGLLYQRTGRDSDALELLTSAYQGGVVDPAVLNLLGQVYLKSGDQAKAVEVWRKSLDVNPDQTEIHRELIEIEGVSVPKVELGGARPAPDKAPATPDAAVADLFLKHVAPEDRPKKAGFNVLIYSDFNIAGQLTKLMRALNAHTPHKARCVIFQDDFLQYDRDIILQDQQGRPLLSDLKEVYDLVTQADFFHIGRQAVNLPGLDFDQILNERNCLMQYFGSDLRLNHERLFLWHLKKNIPALVGYGWTLAFPLPLRYYHVQQFFDPASFSRVDRLKPGDVIRVVHAPTNREIKKTALFLEVMARLQKEFRVEVDVVEGVSNKVCLNRKARGHITYDEMGTPTFGLNSVESMAMGHVSLSSVNPHVLSYFPDCPIVRITEDTLEPLLRRLLTDIDLINNIGDMSYAFIRRHFNEKLSAIRFSNLYNGIKYGFFHCDPGLPYGVG